MTLDHRWWRRWLADPKKLIGYSLIWGAAFGTWAIVREATSAPPPLLATPRILIFAFALAFYTVAGWGGIALLRNEPRALTIAMLAQVPQFLQLQSAWLQYTLLSGIYGNVRLTAAGERGWQLGFESVFAVAIGAVGSPAGIGVNLVAIIVFRYLRKVSRSQSMSARPERPN